MDEDTLNRAPILTGTHATLGEALGAAAEQFGDRTAYSEVDRSVSYREWIARADCLAAYLSQRRVGPGDVVALLLNSSIDYAVAYAATARIGAIVTGINTRLGMAEISAILEKCSPRAIFIEDGFQLPPTSAAIIQQSELLQIDCRPLAFGVRAKSTDPAAIIWTGGTTGQPKGAWFDHAALRNAQFTAGVIAAPYDRRMMPVPFCHAGYMTKVWEQIAFGMAFIIPRTPWRAAAMLDLIQKERVTVAAAVPTQWSKFLELPGLAAADFSSVRLCMAASAPASPDLVEAIGKCMGAPLLVRYAMTEAPSITSTAPDDPPDVLYRTVGKPVHGVEVKLVADDGGAPVPPGEVGRIVLKSIGQMKGYWKAPAETARTVHSDGWIWTGDLGHFDEAGNLILAGRVDDMYIRGGYNIYPVEVENSLLEHPGVLQVGVIGRAAPVIGEIGVAFVVPSSDENRPSAEELRNWVGARLADYKKPDEVVFVSELPLTSMMKVDKRALRERF